MKKVIIEVGVNLGQDTQALLDRYPEADYYGFEPTIELYTDLRDRYKDNPRVNMIPMAVSDYNGMATFNVAGQQDWGCSSLYEFTPEDERGWSGSNFNFTHSYKVPVIRLDTFLSNFVGDDVDIEFIWCDAQGSDNLVMIGMGSYIDKLKAGRIEVAYTKELYQGVNNSSNAAEVFLTFKGFSIKVAPQGGSEEANIEFWRGDADIL